MADGSISFNTKIDTTGVSKGLKEIEREFKETQSRYESLSKKYEANRQKLKSTPTNKNILTEQTSIEKELDKLGPKLEDLRDSVRNMKLLEEPAKEADEYSKKLQTIYERMQKLQSLGIDPNSKAFASLQYDAENTSDKIRNAYAKMESILPDSTNDLTNSLDGIVNGNQEVADSYLAAFGNDKKTLVKEIGSRFNNLSKTLEKTGQKFKKNMLNVAKYAIGVRSLFYLFRKLNSALKEGFNNLRQFGSGSNPVNVALNSLSNSLTYLKNSWAVAFAPILTSVIPILNTLIDCVAAAGNALARFFAMLSGKATYTKAVKQNKDLTKAVNGVASASKKTGEEEKKALASFDEINQLNLGNDSASSGGGSSSDVGDMFADESVGEASEFVTAISEKLLSIWQNLKLVAQEIGTAWNEAWQDNGNGERITSALQTALLSILETINQLTFKTAEWAGNLNLSPLLSSVANLLESISPLIDFIGNCLLGIWESVILPLIGWVAESSLPAFINLIASALNLVLAVLEILKPIIDWFWTNIIAPFVSYFGGGIVALLDMISQGFQMIAEWVNRNSEYITALGVAAAIVLAAILVAIFPVQSAFIALIAILGLVKAHWEELKQTAKSVSNFILGAIEKAINGIIDGINWLTSGARDFLSWAGVETYAIGHVSFPRLATGMVVPPGAGEFAAILGDNNKETEVVSPLSTMKEALKEALAETNGQRNQQVIIRFDGNLAQLARILKPYIEEENNRAGVTFVTSAS